jgi:hypothetical protein
MSKGRLLSLLSSVFLGLVLVLGVAVVPVAARGDHAAAGGLPARINLPDGFQPEGIDSFGPRLFTGSLANGAIWTASARTGNGRFLVTGVKGQVAVGLHVDGRGRLWVAGGPNQTIRVYRLRSGNLLRTYTFPTTGFVNDLVITRRAVYATDSFNQQLAVVPLGRNGRLLPASAATTMPLTGAIQFTTGFNANGIVAHGGFLILDQTNTGLLFRVNPHTGFTRMIRTGGRTFVNADGLKLRGRTLYVVVNQSNLVAVLRLGPRLLHGRFIGNITSPLLDVPTGVTATLGKLWAVNARFDVTPTSSTPYWITRLPRRP